MRMTWGTNEQCSPKELDGLIKIGLRQDAPLLRSVSKADGKIIERHGSIRMTEGMEE
jgi:hypothetical protein